MVKVGDKVRVTQSDGYFEVGDILKVIEIDKRDEMYPLSVDGGMWLENGTFEPIAAEDPEPDYAIWASRHRIKITVTVGDGSVIFDGTK